MEENLKTMWAAAMNSLSILSEEKREHFALMLIRLAACYVKETSCATVLIYEDKNLIMFSAGATEYESAEMIQRANQMMESLLTSDAPPKEMFN